MTSETSTTEENESPLYPIQLKVSANGRLLSELGEALAIAKREKNGVRLEVNDFGGIPTNFIFIRPEYSLDDVMLLYCETIGIEKVDKALHEIKKVLERKEKMIGRRDPGNKELSALEEKVAFLEKSHDLFLAARKRMSEQD